MKVPPRTRGSTEIRAGRSYIARQVIAPLQAQIHAEEAGGVMLLIGTVIGLAWVNSPWAHSYHILMHETSITLDLAVLTLSHTVHDWINDGLMTLFFLLVGLEINREISQGQLSSLRAAAFPVIAAAGGMVLPAALYLGVTWGSPESRGWGIPVATDIAFAMGALALLGSGVPRNLKMFLLAFAVVDDIGGIVIIAVVYAEGLSLTALACACLLVLAVLGLRAAGVQSTGVFVLVGILLWVAVSKSGVHPTIAGVALGLLTPARSYLSRARFSESVEQLMQRYRRGVGQADHEEVDTALGQLEELTRATEEPLERVLRVLRPWVSYVVLPLFALANSSIEVSSAAISAAVSSPATWGIAAGLLIGKPVGVFSAALLAVWSGAAALPAGVNWRQIGGAGLLSGIGFTISLFIAALAFTDERVMDAAKIGILSASLVAGLLGYLFLRVSQRRTA